MVKGLRLAAVAVLGLLGACTRPVDDPLAARSIYWGLAPMPDYEGPLPEVLWSADDTPAYQPLLYTAMAEAEVAAQYAGRALAAEDPARARGALGEVLYAIEPGAAPAWDAKSAGIVRGWAGKGYGLRRAAAEMAGRIRAAAGGEGAAGFADGALPAARCADNTLERADRIVLLSREAFGAAANRSQALLQQIQAVANQLNQGAAASADPDVVDPECGLQQARRYLDRLAPRRS